MLQIVDFRTLAGDTGRANSDSIVPISDGEAADEIAFRRPTEHTRARTQTLRERVRENALRHDFEPCVLSGGGTFTPAVGPGGELLFTTTADLYVLPLRTAGQGLAAPFVASTQAAVSAGVFGVNEVVFTSVQYAYEGFTDAADVNAISIEITTGAALAVSVVDRHITVTKTVLNTCTEVINIVNGHASASILVTASLGAGSAGAALCDLFDATTWTEPSDRFLRGGVPGIAHQITAAGLAAFFGTMANELSVGDTLAVAYDTLVSATTTGGRLQSTPENANINVDAALFNTTRFPELVPNSIPICKRVDATTLLFATGDQFNTTTPGTLGFDSHVNENAELGTLATPLTGWTQIHNGPDHNPPTTIREALDNADGRLDEAYDHMTMGETVLSVGYDGAAAAGYDLMYEGPVGLAAAITAVSGFAVTREGGTIMLWPGGALEEFDISVALPVIDKPMRLTSPGRAHLSNNRGSGAMRVILDLAAGADGSVIENIDIVEGAAASNYALRMIGVSDITVRNCNFIGTVYVHSSSRVLFENCTFTGGTNGAAVGADVAVEVVGIPATPSYGVTFKNCRMAVTAPAVTITGVMRCSTSTDTTNDDQTPGVTFEDCILDVPDGIHGLIVAGNGGCVATNVVITARPYTTQKRALYIYNNAVATFRQLKIALADRVSALVGSLIYVTGTTAVTFDGVVLDTEGVYIGGYVAGSNPVYISANNVVVRGVVWAAIEISDALNDLTIPIFMIQPSHDQGTVTLCDSVFSGLVADPLAAGQIRFTLIGGSAATAGTGTSVFERIMIKADPYAHAVGGSYAHLIGQPAHRAVIRGCSFYCDAGCTVTAPVYLQDAGRLSVTIIGNYFLIGNTPLAGVAIVGNTVTPSYTRITDNVFVLADSRALWVYGDPVTPAVKGVISNNVATDLVDTAPGISIFDLEYLDGWTVIGNAVHGVNGNATPIDYNTAGASACVNMVPDGVAMAIGGLNSIA